jgi:hypothetical protein
LSAVEQHDARGRRTATAPILASGTGGGKTSAATARLRRSLSVLVAVILAVLVAGGAVAAKALNTSSAPSTARASAPTAAAKLLPASTLLFASADLKPGGTQGANLKIIESAFTSQPGFSALVKMVTGQSKKNACDVNKQILTWIDGPITFAVTDPAVFKSTKKTSSTTNGVVVLIAVKPGQSVPGIMTQYGLGTATPVSTYSGEAIYTLHMSAGCGGSASSASPSYAAIANGEVIVGGSVKEMQREISVLQGKSPSLYSTASYQKISQVLAPTGIAYIYLNLPPIIKASASTALGALSGSGSPLGSLSGGAGSANQVANQLGPAAVSFTARPNGLDMQAAALTNATVTSMTGITPNKGAGALPKGTSFYLSIGNLKGIINGVLDAVSSSSPSTGQQLAQVKLVFGNVLNLLDGEFALGLLPFQAGAFNGLGAQNTTALPLAALFDVSKHPEAQSTITTLLAALGSSTGLSFAPAKSSHGSAEFIAKAGYGYAFVKSWMVVSTSIKHVVASIEGVLTGKTPSLAGSKSYQQALGSVGGHKSGVSFLDIGQLRSTLEAVFLPTASAADQAQYLKIRPLLVPIRSIGISSSTSSNGKIVRADMLLVIAK